MQESLIKKEKHQPLDIEAFAVNNRGKVQRTTTNDTKHQVFKNTPVIQANFAIKKSTTRYSKTISNM